MASPSDGSSPAGIHQHTIVSSEDGSNHSRDPREVLDLRGTLGWTREAIAALITGATIGFGVAP